MRYKLITYHKETAKIINYAERKASKNLIAYAKHFSPMSRIKAKVNMFICYDNEVPSKEY